MIGNGQPLQLPDNAAFDSRRGISYHSVGDAGIPHVRGNILNDHDRKNDGVDQNANEKTVGAAR